MPINRFFVLADEPPADEFVSEAIDVHDAQAFLLSGLAMKATAGSFNLGVQIEESRNGDDDDWFTPLGGSLSGNLGVFGSDHPFSGDDSLQAVAGWSPFIPRLRYIRFRVQPSPEVLTRFELYLTLQQG